MSFRTRISLALILLALVPVMGSAAFVAVYGSHIGSPGPRLDSMAVLLVAAAVFALVGSGLLTRVITRPLTELQRSVRRTREGMIPGPIPVGGLGEGDELVELAIAFNELTGSLHRSVAELESTRDSQRATLARLAQTLSSTHDLERLLGLILETAQANGSARAAALFLHSAGRSDLYPAASRGIDPAPVARLQLNEGLVGQVFSFGHPVRGRVGSQPGSLRVALGEPDREQILAVPLRASGRIIGVVALYDRMDGNPFDLADLETARTFAAQAGGAIDNVLLHQEAQRLSITDGLTGLWNHRYLKLALNRELERSVRFNRPLAVLMLDLDRFKAINDRCGHLAGDGVLVEVAARVKREIRQVDVLARYGGEEFVCLLPETTHEGAVRIADRINAAIRSEGFTGDPDGVPLNVTISIGVASYPDHAMAPTELLRAADEALYAAKADGRDRVRSASVASDLGQPQLIDPMSAQAQREASPDR